MAMKFELSPEQKMIRTVMREFAVNELEPIAEEIDRECRHPEESVKKMAKAGSSSVPRPNPASRVRPATANDAEPMTRYMAGVGITQSSFRGSSVRVQGRSQQDQWGLACLLWR